MRQLAHSEPTHDTRCRRIRTCGGVSGSTSVRRHFEWNLLKSQDAHVERNWCSRHSEPCESRQHSEARAAAVAVDEPVYCSCSASSPLFPVFVHTCAVLDCDLSRSRNHLSSFKKKLCNYSQDFAFSAIYIFPHIMAFPIEDGKWPNLPPEIHLKTSERLKVG